MSAGTLLNHQSKKVLIETWGCQMNVADSESMLAMLKQASYETCQTPEQADLIILNTCHIREKARHKVVSRLGVLAPLKEVRPDLKIAVSGCVAQAEGKMLLNEARGIDIILGPGRIHDLLDLVDERESTGKQVLATGFPKTHTSCEENGLATPTLSGRNEVSRFVNIQKGCNNFCTFCVVPFTRGREVSDTPDIIERRVRAMVKAGAREITLLGQNVNSYGLDLVDAGTLETTPDGPFVDLLRRIGHVEGLDRLRFTTSNPHDFPEALAKLFKEQPKLGQYVHLPVQSGSDRILEAMKRKVTVAEYEQRIKWLRSAVPHIAISTDLIVGFPGETDEDFEGTMELLEKVRYDFVYAFKYSPRRGTAAARFREQVPAHVQSARLARLNKRQDEITHEQMAAEVGKQHEVLFLYESQKNPGVYYGRTQTFRLVRVESPRDLVHKTLQVKIESFKKTALTGTLI
ncbi:MAG: tRNA (N6-isopentenyl adenosine(37)-C2)-methylthiotransferase MiaB [Oligoflexales bacterium]